MLTSEGWLAVLAAVLCVTGFVGPVTAGGGGTSAAAVDGAGVVTQQADDGVNGTANGTANGTSAPTPAPTPANETGGGENETATGNETTTGNETDGSSTAGNETATGNETDGASTAGNETDGSSTAGNETATGNETDGSSTGGGADDADAGGDDGVDPQSTTVAPQAPESEPNDGFETATPVTEGTVEGVLSAGETDFFRLDLTNRESLVVDYDQGGGRGANVRLFDSSRDRVQGDGVFGGTARVVYDVERNGTYYVRVANENDNERNYTLNLSVVNASENDAFEYNDAFEFAAPVGEGRYDGRLVGSEADFFRVELTNREAVIVDYDQGGGRNANVRLFDSSRDRVQGDDVFGGTARVVYDVEENGTYYVRLASTNENVRSYDVNVSVVDPVENDAFEYNDAFEFAAPVEEGFLDARLVGSERDLYRVETEPGDTLDVSFSGSGRSPALRLYDEDRDRVANDGVFGGSARVVRSVDGGPYYVAVDESNERVSEYTLDLDRINASENDPFEPNGDLATAIGELE